MDIEFCTGKINFEGFDETSDGIVNAGNLQVKESKNKKAIISIPLMHVGPSLKKVLWTREVLERIAPMFRGVPFKYDVNGSQGSSHVPEHLFSPFYDVGWTYSDDKGSYFDGNTLWVRGEATHPEVVEKLSRMTSDGKRELDAASMGVLLDYAHCSCSICGKKPFGSCNHVRGEIYDGKECYIVPDVNGVSRALHVALTNNPADTEARIHDFLVLQEKNELKGGKSMAENEKQEKLEEKSKTTVEEKKEEKIETAESKMITCPKCGHKFAAESAEMPPKSDVPKADESNLVKNSLPKIGNTDDPTTQKNKSVMYSPEKMETAEYFETKYRERLIQSIQNECKRLGRKELEVAELDIKQLELSEKLLKTTPSPKVAVETADFGYGVPVENTEPEFAEMSADERARKLGDFYKWEAIFNPEKVKERMI